MNVVRYRGTSDELAQRDHFLAMGRDLLPYIDQAIDERQLTPEFVQQWGKIMFCHGMVAAFVFDDSDDLALEHNRRRGSEASKREARHVFLARLILWFMDEHQETRAQAEAKAASAIWSLVDHGVAPEGFALSWFKSLVRDKDRVVTTLEQRKASEAKLRTLAGSDVKHVPAIECVL
jgi:hypothetical protein